MAEVVREEHIHEDHSSGNNAGLIIGAIVLLIVVFLIIFYGLPYIRSMSSTPQVNVPGQIDVNVNEK